jgi:predicted nucleic acid-binding protein
MRFVIDPDVLIAIAAGDVVVREDHQLVAPGSLRSQVQSRLYRAVHDGRLERRVALERLERRVALERLERITEIKVRLLNDRVSRAVAWEIAEQLGLDDTRAAEYLAVTRLQADALVTQDEALARLADGLVRVDGVAALSRPARA